MNNLKSSALNGQKNVSLQGISKINCNMKKVQILDKKFALSIPEKKIQEAIKTISEQINTDFKNRNPLFVSILNGSFMFASDLIKQITIPSEITFIKVASYTNTQSTGVVTEIFGLDHDVENRPVIIVEDIVDSGLTMQKIIEQLRSHGAEELYVATLLLKPDALRFKVPLDYVALRIPNEFIVGYGLDYNGYGRNLRDIYTLMPE